jgi:hypothetical protein
MALTRCVTGLGRRRIRRRISMSMRKRAVVLMASVLVWDFTSYAHAVPYQFVNITHMSPGNAAIGEAQMFLDVTDAGLNQVLFTYSNVGLHACSLTDVYVDDGSLLGIALIINDPGTVEFSEDPTPPNLPGGEVLVPPFEAIRSFSADSDPPAESMGVNPGETLGILYDLASGGTFASVIAELASGDIRIGIHVQGYESGSSESFVNIIPEPATFSLLAFGGLAMLRRRRA